jgi:hypothetical protein
MFSDKSIEDVYDPLSKEWNRRMAIDTKYNRKIDRIQHMSNRMKKYDKQGFNDDPFPYSNYLGLCKKYEVELAVLEIQKDENRKISDKLWDQMNGVFQITDRNSRAKKITKRQKRELEKETCAICYDSHSLKQLTTTSCGHTFGKPCLSKMLEYNYDNWTENVCPCCRNAAFELVRYSV